MAWYNLGREIFEEGWPATPDGWAETLESGACSESFRYHENGLEVSNCGRIRKANGKVTRGTLVHGKYTVKVDGVRTCVAKLVLEVHMEYANGLNNHGHKGLARWLNRDKHYNHIDNLVWDATPGVPVLRRRTIGNAKRSGAL